MYDIEDLLFQIEEELKNGKKSLFPQNTPRSTAYTEEKTKVGVSIKKILTHRSSANKKENFPLKSSKKRQTGRAVKNASESPAVITDLIFSGLFSALYLVINLETVTGVPEQVAVSISP